MPNASVSMTIASHSDEDAETYEVLQSQRLEKQWALTKIIQHKQMKLTKQYQIYSIAIFLFKHYRQSILKLELIFFLKLCRIHYTFYGLTEGGSYVLFL